MQYPSTGIHFEACKGCVGLGALIAAAALRAIRRQRTGGSLWIVRRHLQQPRRIHLDVVNASAGKDVDRFAAEGFLIE